MDCMHNVYVSRSITGSWGYQNNHLVDILFNKSNFVTSDLWFWGIQVSDPHNPHVLGGHVPLDGSGGDPESARVRDLWHLLLRCGELISNGCCLTYTLTPPRVLISDLMNEEEHFGDIIAVLSCKGLLVRHCIQPLRITHTKFRTQFQRTHLTGMTACHLWNWMKYCMFKEIWRKAT